jgi:hypothetical protein
MNKSTLLESQPHPANSSLRPAVQHTDITRGARHLGIRHQRVLVVTTVQDDYAEPDVSLGFNAVGVILRVLAQHLAACPGGGGNDSIEVRLHRREDGRLVEVQIAILRSRRQGQECLLLSRLSDRPVDHEDDQS